MELVSVIRIMMRRDKILILIQNLEDINKYEKLGIANFLFPLEDFSIGYNTFKLEELSNISGNIYVLCNRILTDDDIDKFLKLNIPKNIKGFFIEDTGLYYELKDKGYELVNYQNHLNNNYETVNYWLGRFDSIVLSTDLSLEEMQEIVLKSSKPVVFPIFGYPMAMYSRRTLVSNYYKSENKDVSNSIEISDKVSNVPFKLVESHYGTAVFYNYPCDYREALKEELDVNIKFYFVNSVFCSFETIKRVVEGESITGTKNGFLNAKTTFKVGDLK